MVGFLWFKVRTNYPPLGCHVVEPGIAEGAVAEECEDVAEDGKDPVGIAEQDIVEECADCAEDGTDRVGIAEQGIAEGALEGRVLEGVAEEGINGGGGARGDVVDEGVPEKVVAENSVVDNRVEEAEGITGAITGAITEGVAEQGVAEGIEKGGVREDVAKERVAVQGVVEGGMVAGVEETVGEEMKNCIDKLSPGSLGITHSLKDICGCYNTLLGAWTRHARKNSCHSDHTRWGKP